MDNKEIIEKLKDDEHYYGDFGKQYLSNSDISALLNNPLDFKKPSPPNPAFVVGGYFHTTILEPQKLDKYKIIKSSTRNTLEASNKLTVGLLLWQNRISKLSV